MKDVSTKINWYGDYYPHCDAAYALFDILDVHPVDRATRQFDQIMLQRFRADPQTAAVVAFSWMAD